MNLYIREKITGRIINQLEVIEEKRMREEDDEDCLVITSPTFLVIFGMIGLALGVIPGVLCIREGDYLWGLVGITYLGGIGGWLTGYSLFWKVVIDHEKVEYHSLFFGIGRNYPLKDITRVCYNEIEEIEVYKGKRRVFKVSSGTYGMDELVEWFREEGVLVEDNTPREECYKIMWHTEEAWIVIIVVNVMGVTPGIGFILYCMYKNISLQTTGEILETIVYSILVIGALILEWLLTIREKVFYLKYQDGKYSYHRLFHKEKPFELDERITYKARKDGIVIYQDGKRLFVTFHGYTNAEFFGRTLLEKISNVSRESSIWKNIGIRIRKRYEKTFKCNKEDNLRVWWDYFAPGCTGKYFIHFTSD